MCTSGCMLCCRYTDWYVPPPQWAQPAVDILTVRTEHLLFLDKLQPNLDAGLKCTVAMANSPFGSLNWAKLPCDFPLHSGAAICKQPAAFTKPLAGINQNNTINERVDFYSYFLLVKVTQAYIMLTHDRKTSK